jgi:hypothetical protein
MSERIWDKMAVVVSRLPNVNDYIGRRSDKYDGICDGGGGDDDDADDDDSDY